jgi:hypothetical protein
MTYIVLAVVFFFLGMIFMSLMAMSKITQLDHECSHLRMRLSAAHRLFDSFGIKLNDGAG